MNTSKRLMLVAFICCLELLNIYLGAHSFGAHPHFGAKVGLSLIFFLSFAGICVTTSSFGVLLLTLYTLWSLFLLVSLYQIGSLPFWYFIAVIGTQEAKAYLPLVYFLLAASLIPAYFFYHKIPFRPLASLTCLLVFLCCLTVEDKVAVINDSIDVDLGSTDFNKAAERQRTIKVPMLYPADFKDFVVRALHPRRQSENYAYHLMRDDPLPLTAFYATYNLLFNHPVAKINLGKLKLPDNVHKSDSLSVAKHIVIVIGESSTPDRYGVYGYKEDTTPNLQKLIRNKELCKVDRAHSAAPITRFAILPSLSFWSPNDLKGWIKKENLVSLANKAGYSTYFISAQEELSTYSGSNGAVAKLSNRVLSADICKHCDALNPTGQNVNGDDSLIAPYEKALEDPGDKKLIFLHLYGSHERYEKRVTDYERKHFPNLGVYDQTIAHTDRVLSTVINDATAKWGKDFTLVYFSDHGEEVADNSDFNLAGHGLMKNRKQYEIPILSNQQSFCNSIEAFRADNGMYSTRLNIYPLISLLGYSVDKDSIDHLKKDDVVLHTDERIYTWEKVPR